MLAFLLLQSFGSNNRADASRHHLMQSIVRRMAAGRVAETPEGLFRDGLLLCSSGRFPAAAEKFETAIALGHTASRAELAWILIQKDPRGAAFNAERAFRLAEAGSRLGCLHSRGVLACCYAEGRGCEADYARAMMLASESASAGCRYGQYVLGSLHDDPPKPGIECNFATAAAHYRSAAAQQLEVAQWKLGYIYAYGYSGVINRDDAEALHRYKQAADQGHSSSCFQVAMYYEQGLSVPVDVAEAVRWYMCTQAFSAFFICDSLNMYKRALEGGVLKASVALRRLGVVATTR